ncbi:hypothetical protein FQR65_LT10065 [Abscondita terminalis]|nr:hypothetical protein FQR65_LT10065 [Abscondita terminalis]
MPPTFHFLNKSKFVSRVGTRDQINVSEHLPSLQLSDYNNKENRTTSDGCNITRSNIAVVGNRIDVQNQRTLKITLNSGFLIRWLAVSSSDTWLGTGQSSGHIAVLDTKTGFTISTWRAQETEVLELVVYGKNTLISSSLVQVINAWNVQDGRLKCYMR